MSPASTACTAKTFQPTSTIAAARRHKNLTIEWSRLRVPDLESLDRRGGSLEFRFPHTPTNSGFPRFQAIDAPVLGLAIQGFAAAKEEDPIEWNNDTCTNAGDLPQRVLGNDPPTALHARSIRLWEPKTSRAPDRSDPRWRGCQPLVNGPTLPAQHRQRSRPSAPAHGSRPSARCPHPRPTVRRDFE